MSNLLARLTSGFGSSDAFGHGKKLPYLGGGEVVYNDVYKSIYHVTAEFGSFAKEYFVTDVGRRAGIVVVDGDRVLLVSQYRLLVNGFVWEIPGGKVDEHETAEAGAIRECHEETGLTCSNLTEVLRFMPGLDSHRNPTHIFSTSTWTGSLRSDDPMEVVELTWMPLARCLEMIFAGQIVDGLSVAGLLGYYARVLREAGAVS